MDRPTKNPCVNEETALSSWRTPKRLPALGLKGGEWYPYYAGFSAGFAADVLASLRLPSESVVLDPWNGSGTTTEACSAAGLTSVGVDLNPAMVVVARARTVSASAASDLSAGLGRAIKLRKSTSVGVEDEDALLVWLSPSGVQAVRTVLVQATRHLGHVPSSEVKDLSAEAALVYTALFLSVRRIVGSFRSSNPTWIKPPKSKRHRLRPSFERVRQEFFSSLSSLLVQRERLPLASSPAQIILGSSENLPLPRSTVDAVIASPPYCTRLDYAVATAPELSLLGLTKAQQDPLRRLLIGSPLVRGVAPVVNEQWGPCCLDLLAAVRVHPSKDSAGYYTKHFLRYFECMYASVREIDRVLRRQGRCVLVVQDSFYKDLPVDLQQILIDMVSGLGWSLEARRDYQAKRAMSDINPASRKWRERTTPCESVLLFEKS
ncbi:MAG: hypothetical protein JKY65_11020 [Planctomycetes bacterium]|nr:hypothetical protein [Planctomycetota bacterium]